MHSEGSDVRKVRSLDRQIVRIILTHDVNLVRKIKKSVIDELYALYLEFKKYTST